MTRELKAVRYAEDVRPGLKDLITDALPYMSFWEAQDTYSKILSDNPRESEIALLGCNDRFFLLVALLNRRDAVHPWIYGRCREVEERPDGYLNLWARMHYKSTIETFAGLIQEALIDPEQKIAIFSNTKDIARPFLSQIKEELEGNEFLKKVYSDVLFEDPRKHSPSWSVANGLVLKRKTNPKEATFEAHGLIDSMPVGRHFSILMYDDVITEKNVSSPDQIQKATERVELSDNLGEIEGTRKRYNGTRYSYADSYGILMEHGIAIPRIYPATHDGSLDGTPVLLSEEAWEERKQAQRSTIAAQMLQNPLAGKENTFRIAWLQPFFVRPQVSNVYILCDPSRGKHATSDRTAMPVVAIDATGNKYLIDGYCHRMSLSERWQNLKELWLKWSKMPGVQRCAVGYERYGQQTDDEYFEEQMKKKTEPRFEITEVAWVKDGQQGKTFRVERLEPDFRRGRFYVPGRVWHDSLPDGPDVARWEIKEDTDEFEYRVCPGLERFEREVRGRGQAWRCFDPIRRVDQDGKIYDLTRVFFEEYRFFPFSPRKDLVDAMSRIYDMEPMNAMVNDNLSLENFHDD